ncbi:serine/threonine-protein kinase [Streptomyces sp. NPDC127072]|uniref:serine/threonine-protein kinase n=1 Tax=Streptomyces sp. NPDC127072 TaxID=3347129 RepID=UPI0036527192
MSSGENRQADGVGRLLAGRYRVLAQLGRGGMGVVWRAHDEILRREVAVKELRTFTDAAAPELADLSRRMQREARAAARVRHPGVVAVHDVAEADGRPLIVMELVDGPSLDDVLRERGTLDPREAASIGAKVMDALAAAHRAGVLHRDVKPGNILLDRSGRVVLTDFGIATMEDPGDGSATHLTRSGELVGSLDYLAPERAQGDEPGPASDVWALGATLYAAVEGGSPFRRTSTWSTLTAIVAEPLPEPVRAGPLGPVLRELMHKDPEARPDADRACALLEAVAGGPEADSVTRGLRLPEPQPRPRETTVLSVPSVPPGFGPPEPVPSASVGFGPPEAVPPASTGFGPPESVGRQASAEAAAPPPASRRRGRVLLAAAAVTVVLVATGVTVALLNSPDKADAAAGAPPSRGTAGANPSAGASLGEVDLSDDAKPSEQGDKESTAPEQEPTPTGGTTARPSKSPVNGAGTGGTSGGGTGGSTDGGTTGGGSSTAPTSEAPVAPVCDAIGGGKYNCQVWRTAKSYTASGTEVGVLNAGTNYFYCQQNLGRRETYGEWTNVWWARTDDDSGNADVFVSDVYIQGGDNDSPVPGLPVC